MLGKLIHYLNIQFLPFYWDQHQNQFNSIKAETLSKYKTTMEGILKTLLSFKNGAKFSPIEIRNHFSKEVLVLFFIFVDIMFFFS